jgi:hypothetical protein
MTVTASGVKAGLKAAVRSTEIALLKRKMRKLYYQRERLFDGTDCGHALKMVISPSYAAVHTAFEAAWDRLIELDPTCPPRSE